MYGFSEEFLLDYKSLDDVLEYYDDGLDFEDLKAEILLSKISEALTGKKTRLRKKRDKRSISDKPDLKKFHALYGNKIKKPPKKEK